MVHVNKHNPPPPPTPPETYDILDLTREQFLAICALLWGNYGIKQIANLANSAGSRSGRMYSAWLRSLVGMDALGDSLRNAAKLGSPAWWPEVVAMGEEDEQE